MSTWKDEKTFTTVSELLKEVPGGPSMDHNLNLKAVEEEILKHYNDFAHFCNEVCKENPNAGKQFYDLDEAMYFDLMCNVLRPGFREHYDRITPYQ